MYTLIRKYKTALIVKPAHYDESIFPKSNQQVTFLLYLSNDLPVNKRPEYYEVGQLKLIKWMNESNIFVLKIPDNWDDSYQKLDLTSSSLHQE